MKLSLLAIVTTLVAGLQNDPTINEHLYITPQGKTTNNFVCLTLRDKIWEQSTAPFLHPSQRQDLQVTSQSFDKNGCYNNVILPDIDKDLIEKLSDNLTA